jgi:hypothetical protein
VSSYVHKPTLWKQLAKPQFRGLCILQEVNWIVPVGLTKDAYDRVGFSPCLLEGRILRSPRSGSIIHTADRYESRRARAGAIATQHEGLRGRNRAKAI